MAKGSSLAKKSEKNRPAYHRILLKLSGESLQGPQGFGIDGETIHVIAKELREVHKLGVQIAIMVGGGNIFRGARQKGFEIDRAGSARRAGKSGCTHAGTKRHRDASGV
jgi:uridylate kinase